jgi:hypothetical protein
MSLIGVAAHLSRDDFDNAEVMTAVNPDPIVGYAFGLF